CFTLNGLLGTHHSAQVVEDTLASGFSWRGRLPDDAEQIGLQLVASRPCLYGEGRTAHLMFRHNAEPLSLFMLPDRRRAQQMIDVLGHEAVMWSTGDRTLVLISREPRAEVERLAAYIRSSIR